MGGSMTLEEDRLILHDLRGVNLKVDFFLGTREEYLENTKCISYSVCYDSVDVRLDQVTYLEPLYDLNFYHSAHQLFIDDHTILGDVISFRCEQTNAGLIAFCTILLGKEY